MSRHDPHADDFSFLPTVDDTEALDPRELWMRARALQGNPDDELEVEDEAEETTAEAAYTAEAEVETIHAEATEEVWDDIVQEAYEPPADEPMANEEVWPDIQADGDPEPIHVEDTGDFPVQSTSHEPEELVAEWEHLDDGELVEFSDEVEQSDAGLVELAPVPFVEPHAAAFAKLEMALAEEGENFSQEPESYLEQTAAVVLGASNAEAPEAPADNAAELAKAKRSALMVALTTVAGIMLLLMLVRIVVPEIPAAEITAYSAADAITESESLKKIASAAPQTTPMAASLMPIAAAGVSDIAIPQVDITTSSSDLNIGSSMGSFSGGVSSGTAGGTISFMGNRGTGRRIVYVVDVSSSMSARGTGEGSGITRFELLKRELSRSVTGMPAGAQYQVIYFSDFAWAHNEVDSTKPAELQKAFWEISSDTVATAKIPHARYITANMSTLRRSKEIIEGSDNPGGTNWGSGLIMALSMRPAPDVIFFMTDGNRNDESGWIEAVTAFNAKQGGRTVIHTTAMMDPDAATELNQMASNNRGKFSVVLGNGKVLKGEDWFKGVRQ